MMDCAVQYFNGMRWFFGRVEEQDGDRVLVRWQSNFTSWENVDDLRVIEMKETLFGELS